MCKNIKSYNIPIYIFNLSNFSGPGQYDNHAHTTFTNFNKPISTKGYIFGARTAQRQFYQLKVYLFFLIFKIIFKI
jgi:hypothetical protein